MATMNTSLKIKDFLHERPKPSGLDVVCKLQNFAIITYAVSPERFNGLIPPRFKLDTVVINGEEKALISVVPFIDVDFTSAVVPFPKFRLVSLANVGSSTVASNLASSNGMAFRSHSIFRTFSP